MDFMFPKEDKAGFVKDFAALLQKTSEYSDIERMDYVKNDEEEVVYITYTSGDQQIINVHMDSLSAIMKDFFNQISKASWVVPPKDFKDEVNKDGYREVME